MSIRVFVTEQAVRDVIRNAKWWEENHSHDQAFVWQQAIFAKIYSLDTFPESHALASEDPKFPYELREALFGLGSSLGYRIFFTIVEKQVRVLTVRAAEEQPLMPEDVMDD